MDQIVVEPDQASFRRCIRALNDEADGTEWFRDAEDEIGEALRPGVDAVRAALYSRMETHGLDHGGESLRAAVAGAVSVSVRLRGRHPAAAIRASKTGMPRGFRNAPKRLNDRSFRHPVFTKQVWVTQIGAPGWFDEPLRLMRPRLASAAARALERRARRITRKAP